MGIEPPRRPAATRWSRWHAATSGRRPRQAAHQRACRAASPTTRTCRAPARRRSTARSARATRSPRRRARARWHAVDACPNRPRAPDLRRRTRTTCRAHRGSRATWLAERAMPQSTSAAAARRPPPASAGRAAPPTARRSAVCWMFHAPTRTCGGARRVPDAARPRSRRAHFRANLLPQVRTQERLARANLSQRFACVQRMDERRIDARFTTNLGRLLQTIWRRAAAAPARRHHRRLTSATARCATARC